MSVYRHPFFGLTGSTSFRTGENLIEWNNNRWEERKHMKKAVFFDIDGTIWDAKMQIPDSTREAIRKLREQGHYAFLCSGRSRSNIRSPKLLELGFDGMVAACGAHIEFDGKKKFESLLSQEETAHALAVLHKHHMPVVLEGPEYIYVDGSEFLDDPYVIYLRNELGDDLRPITGTETYHINKMSAEIGKADVAQFIADLGEEFAVIVHAAEGLVEVGKRGFSKATGIERVCKMLDIRKEDTYAFGDSANDLDMLSFVGHGIAMGNGTKEAKEAAEYVTAPINQDGICLGLEHYGLI